MDEKQVAEFRKKLVEDVVFRHKFADDPDGALRSIGIDVPEGAQIPPIDKAELDSRIDRLKASMGANLNDLYSVKDFARISRDSKKLGRYEEITNIAKRLGGPFSGGQVYTISAFGTLDW